MEILAMSSTEAPKPASRGRVARAVEDANVRRRRDPNDNGIVKRLHVPPESKDPNFRYRWVVDQPGRIDQLYRQDWDLVTDDELGAAVPATRHADVAQNRLALNTRLMKKPVEFFEADHAANQKRLDEEMKAAELGQKVLNGPNGAGLEAGDPRVYTPRDADNKL
jgi:hypothetical protein